MHRMETARAASVLVDCTLVVVDQTKHVDKLLKNVVRTSGIRRTDTHAIPGPPHEHIMTTANSTAIIWSICGIMKSGGMEHRGYE
jgi:hypothetical protein